ncbi:uncharacterized protein LOC124933025 [Impatiens glandulifera]|uniref:uncharacterized protein LOC124933025 n=1 Tax=Impatiens glandulifera TaxID=253017 RepID=UPI001FB07B97|nr:uncharacterized protein LOC124933025 [Impatiens glandulifera]
MKLNLDQEKMVSREKMKMIKRGRLHDQNHLQLLGSITNSTTTGNKTSIVMGAAKYIKDLKHKVETLSEGIMNSTGCTSTTNYHQNPYPMVTVNTLEKGFLVRVCSEESCQGLLVSVLEAFEDIGLNVLQARASCTNNFQLEVIGVGNEENEEIMDAQMVKWAVSKAINNWTESSSHVSEDQD